MASPSFTARLTALPAFALPALGLAAALIAGGTSSAVLGVAVGAVIALHAVGLALVWRADRVLNFSQVALGLLAGSIFVQGIVRRQWLVWLHDACNTCVAAPPAVAPGATGGSLADRLANTDIVGESQRAALAADGWLVVANTVLTVGLAVAVGIGGAYLVHRLVIVPLSDRPRVVATVATVGVAQLITALAIGLPQLLGALAGGDDPLAAVANVASPIESGWDLGDVVLTATDLAAIALAVLSVAAITVWLRRGATGIRLRAVADAPERAAALGVDNAAVAGRAWLVAGALSTSAALLAALSGGIGLDSGFATLAAPLAAAVAAGLGAVGLAAAAAFGIGLIQQAGLAAADASWPGTVALLLVVAASLAVAGRGVVRRAGTAGELAGSTAEELRPLPKHLADHPPVRTARRAGGSLLLLALILLPLILDTAQVVRLTVVLAYALVALSVLVLTGWAGQLSLGQFGLSAVGAWVMVACGLPLPVALPVAMLATAAAAGLLGVVALRLGGIGLGVVTLLLAAAVTVTLLNPSVLGDAVAGDAFTRPSYLEDEDTLYWVGLVLVALAAIAVVGLRQSRFARVLIAGRENPDAAAGLGVDVRRAQLLAFAVSGALAAAGGVLIATAQVGVRAEGFPLDRGIELLCVAVIGGLGAVSGPLLGAAYLGLVTLVLTGNGIAEAATGLGLIVVLLVAPSGLAGVVTRVRDAFVVLVAARAGLDTTAIGGQAGSGGRVPLAPVSARTGVRYRLRRQWLVDAEREGGTS